MIYYSNIYKLMHDLGLNYEMVILEEWRFKKRIIGYIRKNI
jgi:hypothetical protein